MAAYDSDAHRWGLNQLFDVCSISNAGSHRSITRCDPDHSQLEYVREGYVESEHPYVDNDEILAHAFQEELSRIALHKSSVDSAFSHDDFQSSVLAQDWLSPLKRFSDTQSNAEENCFERAGDLSCREEAHDHDQAGTGVSFSNNGELQIDQAGTGASFSNNGELKIDDDEINRLHIADESLDGEMGKRLNQMVSIPHIPKVNGDLPSVDEVVSDHQRLLDRLQLYDLVENKIQGDGNCQFRPISDQLYRSPEYHKFVREEIIQQLKTHPELYDGYVPMTFEDYLKNMSMCGEWGDHVTLQAAADWYGVKIFVITSFKDTCYLEILPHIQKSKRVIFLSFWAEVHYNSIYPEGDLPFPEESRRRKKWWDVLRI